MAIDLTGCVFSRLTVIAKATPSSSGRTRWLCLCTCGGQIAALGCQLESGSTKSCGCLKREITAAQQAPKHGHTANGTETPTFRSWHSMLTRCTNPNHEAWPKYGGRGIVVCERWQRFENFLADMGERPPRTSLDRYPNNDGNYEPGSVRWATASDQARNRRSNRLLTLDGATATITEWSERTGISVQAIQWRLDHGWSTERALTQPVHKLKGAA